MNDVLVKNEGKILQFQDDEVDLLKRTICKGATDEEFLLFMYACKRTGLDPFMKQVYAVKRWDSSLQREVMRVQTSIDGYRLIAERTGKYVPGRETCYTYDNEGKLLSATSFVKKQTKDGTWHEISATAFYSEYVAIKKDGNVNEMWKKLPHAILSKCAESLALRKAFPANLSGIYTDEEMQQSETSNLFLTNDQCEIIEALIDCDENPKNIREKLLSRFDVKTTDLIPANKFDSIVTWMKQRLSNQQEKIAEQKKILQKEEELEVYVEEMSDLSN